MSTYQGKYPEGYYVYAYIRNKDTAGGKSGTPYYIGKGYKKRAWQQHRDRKTNTGIWTPTDHNRIVVIAEGLTELWAFAHERWLIRFWGRVDQNSGILQNRTDGGDGACGIIRSKETIEKMRLNGKNMSQETRSKISQTLTGHQVSESTRIKQRDANLGKPCSEGKREKLRAFAANRQYEPEYLKKLSDATKDTKWWNNGTKNARTKECPGIDWVLGKTKV